MTDIQKPVYVQIDRFEGEDAYCKANYNDGFVPVTLNKKSLEDCDLRVGENFYWLPRLDGIVRLEDVSKHPRRKLTDEEIQEGGKTAERLRENWNPEHW